MIWDILAVLGVIETVGIVIIIVLTLIHHAKQERWFRENHPPRKYYPGSDDIDPKNSYPD